VECYAFEEVRAKDRKLLVIEVAIIRAPLLIGETQSLMMNEKFAWMRMGE
jgi:hypothetical protein